MYYSTLLLIYRFSKFCLSLLISLKLGMAIEKLVCLHEILYYDSHMHVLIFVGFGWTLTQACVECTSICSKISSIILNHSVFSFTIQSECLG